jgi:hypothetical protein
MLLAAVANLVLNTSVLAPPVAIKVPLRLAPNTSEALGYAGIRFFSMNAGTRGLKGISVPKSFGVTNSALVFVDKDPIAVVATKTPNGKQFAKVWVDFNRNKKFENSELAVPSGKSNLYREFDQYNFKGKPSGRQGPVRASVIAIGTSFAGLVSTSAMEGSFAIGDKRPTASILDTNFDGFYGSKGGQYGDTIVYRIGNPIATQSVNQLLPLYDGRYYSCEVSLNGKLLTLTRDETPLGTVAASNGKLAIMNLRGPKTSFQLAMVDGEARAPAGDYSLMSATLTTKGHDGNTYILTYLGGRNHKVAIEAAKTTKIAFGEEVKLTLTASSYAQAKQFSLALTDKNRYRINQLDNTSGKTITRPTEPQLIIYGPDGSVVETQDFHYG